MRSRPAAFTKTCSENHVPPYVTAYDQFKAKGVDAIVSCLSLSVVKRPENDGETDAHETALSRSTVSRPSESFSPLPARSLVRSPAVLLY